MADGVPTVMAAESHQASETERLLADRVASGDAAAFARLVDAHRDRVTRLAYRLIGWGDDAEDVVQDVFLSALKHIGRFRGSCGLSAWLTTITVNTCRSRWRRRLVRTRFFETRRSPSEVQPHGTPDTAFMDRETFAGVREAVKSLPARDREVIVLRYLEEMSPAEVGQVLGLSTSAVAVRLSRAKKRLKRQLGDLAKE